eukprot:1370815-Pyramimonas_sp.AAC.1
MQDYAGATVTLIFCVEVLGVAFWHTAGSSRRNSQGRCTINGTDRCMGHMKKRSLEGRVYSSIVGDSW